MFEPKTLPERWVRTAGEWPDQRDEIASVIEARPGVYEISAQVAELLLRGAGFRPIPETVVLPPHEDHPTTPKDTP